MTPRVTSSVLVSALLRRAEAEGGFGAVVAKGDPTAGSVIVILLERGRNPRLLERILQPDGRYAWQPSPTQVSDNPGEIPAFVARRRGFDRDLWVLELDIPASERFAAEMNALD